MTSDAPPVPDVPAPFSLVIEPRLRELGDGVQVRRVLPSMFRRAVGPFVFLDEMGPIAFAAGRGMDVRPHPHIHLATLTYLFEGEILHRDSLGSEQRIRPGELNWMTAGRGIVHSERTAPDVRTQPSRMHGLQCWCALPRANEDDDPSFTHHGGDALPIVEQGGAHVRVVAGSWLGASSPLETPAPTCFVDCTLDAGATLPWPDAGREQAIYVVTGSIEANGHTLAAGKLGVLEPGLDATILAREPTRFALLGGDPLDGERHIWWNFVSSSRERIEQAKRDWQDHRFPVVPGDDVERIPLPDR